MKQKKVPMRMCVGCRAMRPKRELVRIVRGAEGVISIDPKGKAPGRGAYLCAQSGVCLEKAVKTRALERALEHPIEAQVYESLRAQVPNVPSQLE